MNLNVNYLGLNLTSPVIVASSPFTTSADKICQLEEHGAGAVVLKSVFEEQIDGESAFLERFSDYPEAADYLKGYLTDDYLKQHLNIISEAKRRVRIPVIASINCDTLGSWADYAKSIESAGADALELNIYILPSDLNQEAAAIEKRYVEIVEAVTSKLNIPVSVKLGMRFTNVLNVAREIYYRNARGVVLFNRFFEPDIDIENIDIVASSDMVSAHAELRNSLRTVALCAPQLPMLDIAVSTGVHAGEDVVKSLLVGAKAVEVCSALYMNGISAIGEMNDFVQQWMLRQGFETISDFCGKLSYKGSDENELYQRAQYMRYFPRG